MNRKGTYFVPFQQDDFRAKPTSCVADFTQILPAAEAALEGRQLEPDGLLRGSLRFLNFPLFSDCDTIRLGRKERGDSSLYKTISFHVQ